MKQVQGHSLRLSFFTHAASSGSATTDRRGRGDMIWKMHGTGYVDDKVVAEADFAAMIQEKL